MSILFKKYMNKMKGNAGFGKWYGRAVILDTISTKELAEEVSHATTVTYADVLAVLAELTSAIKGHLQNSQRVKLDGIGSFRVGIVTAPAESRKSFSAANIKRFNINYQPEVKFQPSGEASSAGKRLGIYVKPLLSGITAREYGTQATAAGGTGTSGTSGSASGSGAGTGN